MIIDSRSALAVARRRKRSSKAIHKLLDSWMKVDPAEQRETFRYLKKSIDKHRSPRKLFTE